MRPYRHSRFSAPNAWETWAGQSRSQTALSYLKVEGLRVKYSESQCGRTKNKMHAYHARPAARSGACMHACMAPASCHVWCSYNALGPAPTIYSHWHAIRTCAEAKLKPGTFADMGITTGCMPGIMQCKCAGRVTAAALWPPQACVWHGRRCPALYQHDRVCLIHVFACLLLSVGPGEDDRQAATIMANHPAPADCPLYYFEVEITNK